SDGARIELVESAVTVTNDADLGPMASYAVIVSNPSTDVALITELDVRLLDGAGVPVLNLDADRDVIHSVVNLIMPGQTQAISNLAYIEHDDVDSIEVDIGNSKWAPPQEGRF